jgi:hypothetical protein
MFMRGKKGMVGPSIPGGEMQTYSRYCEVVELLCRKYELVNALMNPWFVIVESLHAEMLFRQTFFLTRWAGCRRCNMEYSRSSTLIRLIQLRVHIHVASKLAV